MNATMVRRFANLEIDLSSYRVSLDGYPVILPYRAYALLEYLSSRPGKVVETRKLLEEAFGMHDLEDLRLVDEKMRYLKMKLSRGGRSYIQRVEGQGYLFDPDPKT